jgi:hypothetical protein
VSGTVEGLERGVVGTTATIEKMHKLVAIGKLDPTLQKIATWIRTSVPSDRRGSTKDTADAIFKWVQQHGIFVRDPFQIEKIELPIEAMRAIIEARKAGKYTGPGLFSGDCDTYAIMTATLGGILGFQYAFETAKVDASRPDEFSHVWTALLIGNEWYPLDSSTGGAYPGWRPPVDATLFARWDEKPIESTVGSSDMNRINGGGLLGDTSDNNASPLAGVDAAYPKDYISYGIPRDFGAGPGIIPPGNFADLQLLVPYDTQIPDADLQPDMHYLKAGPLIDPSERIQSIDGQPDDHGNPYYQSDSGMGAPPYYKVEKQFYPPGSRWNGQMGQDSVRYVKTGAYVQVKSPESPERQVRTTMAQPMTIRRRTVMTSPRRVPFGAMEGIGMGQDDTSGIVTSIDATPSTPAPSTAPTEDQVTAAQMQQQAAAPPTPNAVAPPTSDPMNTAVFSLGGSTPQTVAPTGAASTPQQQAAAQAGSGVWGTISSALNAAGAVAPAAMQSSLMKSVIGITNSLAGKNVLGAAVALPFYKNPFVIGALLATIGGAYYINSKSRPGSGGRRRRR